MKKFTLLTFDSHKEALLKAVQRFEDVHFNDLSRDEAAGLEFLTGDFSGEDVSGIESEIAKVKFAAKRLLPYAEKKKGLKALTEKPRSISFEEFDGYAAGYDYRKVYDCIKEQDEAIKSARDEKAKLNSESLGLKPWLGLDAAPEQLAELKSAGYFLGTVNNPEAFRESLESSHNCYIEFFGKTKEETSTLVVFCAEDYEEISAAVKSLGFTKATLAISDTPAEIIERNNARIAELNEIEKRAEEAVAAKSAEYPDLMITLDYYNTLLERAKVRENFLKFKDSASNILLLEGWLPESGAAEFERIVSETCGSDCFLELAEVPRDSADVPIKLKNNKFVSAFEEITSMYSIPRYNEIDPTSVVAPFYILFFGLMVGDAGYGLILVIATALALKFLNLKKGMRNFMKFFHILGYGTILGGVLYGSVLGFGPEFLKFATGADGVPKAILDSQTDVIQLLLFSVALGFVHIIFGLFVKGYALIRDGKWLDAIFDSLSWIVAVVSLCGLIVSMAMGLPAIVSEASKWGMIGSFVLLLLTQGRSYKTVAGKIGGGVYGLYGITSYVGDLISYTRIAALMLSGAYIAYSFNLIADLMPAGIVKIIAGFIIVVIGALLNMGLGMLGAYVHTCRLQYVEFFGKFYEGGGKPFKPFALKNTFINIKK